METNKKLLDFCKYYKGNEGGSKEGDEMIFVEAETLWFNIVSNDFDNNLVNSYLTPFIASGVDNVGIGDDTPILLKAILFSRFMSVFDMAKPNDFEVWYNKYKNGGN